MVDDKEKNREFAKLQYEALRQEILGIKERVIKLQLIGISGIPLVIGAGEKYDLSSVLMVSPLVTLIFAFMLIFEQGSLMRAGEYIKDILEPALTENSILGWESWLQEEGMPRRESETFFAWSVHIAFAVYFIIGSWLAYGAIHKTFGQLASTVGIGLYCGGFALAMYLIISNFRIGTGPAKRKG